MAVRSFPSAGYLEVGMTTDSLSRVLDGRRAELERAFWSFHTEHPEVYLELVRLARIWRSRGRDRWGTKSAFEVLRWERRIRGLPDDREAFKLNNNYTAFYARLIMEREADLEGVFELRASARGPQHACNPEFKEARE